MKFWQEITDWGKSSTPNHIYYLSEDKSRMVGYIKQGSSDLFKFKKPIRFDTKGRKFELLPRKGEPDSVYFKKEKTPGLLLSRTRL